MNRIDQCFKSLKNRTAFIGYIMSGYPTIQDSLKIMKELPNHGVDIIELGIPFSEASAEGATIQKASQIAIKNKCNLKEIFKITNKFRESNNSTPIVLMGYYNNILSYGEEQFIADCNKYGVDGVLLVDLPFEESKNFNKKAQNSNLAFIQIVTPMTNEQRFKEISQYSSGFIYYISVNGVTGTQSASSESIINFIQNKQNLTNIPIVAGFGIKNKTQIQDLKNNVMGIVVGSAIINNIMIDSNNNIDMQHLLNYISELTKAL